VREILTLSPSHPLILSPSSPGASRLAPVSKQDMATRLVICLLVNLSILDANQLRDPPVPAGATAAARQGALPLAWELSAVGIPMGVVTTEDPATTVTRSQSSSLPGTTLRAALAALNETHPRYSSSGIGDVLTVEERGLQCGALLDRTTLEFTTLDGDMLRLLMLLAWVASGDPGPVPSSAVKMVALPSGTPSRARSQLHIEIPAQTTMRAALNLIVKKAAGGAWIVWDHPTTDGRRGCRMVGYASDGTAIAIGSKDFKVLP
jgi:hypothetical protein